MNEQELLALKGQIDKANNAVLELKGQEKALLEQLKEWQCKTVGEAEVKLKEMEEEISVFNNKITQGTEELQKKYNV